MSGPDARVISPITSRFADDPRLAPLVVRFVQDLPDRLRNLTAAWEAGYTPELARIAHAIGGAGFGHGFPDIRAAASSLEGRLIALDQSANLAAAAAVAREFHHLVETCRRACATP